MSRNSVGKPFYESGSSTPSCPSVRVFWADAIKLLRSLPSESADLIFLDPPFNLGKQYGSLQSTLDRKSPVEYEAFLENLVDASIRALALGGALYVYHLPNVAVRMASKAMESLSLRHWIAISMKNGFVRGTRLYPAHYALLYLTKGDPSNFTRPKVPIRKCRHCNGILADYGGYKDKVGDFINLGDIWDDLSPVRHRTTKTRKANELPKLLYERVVQISGTPGGIFVDPFVSTGTSLLVARARGMNVVAGDLDKTSLQTLAQRVSEG